MGANITALGAIEVLKKAVEANGGKDMELFSDMGQIKSITVEEAFTMDGNDFEPHIWLGV